MPMKGIGPLFRAYESLVLPLNYIGVLKHLVLSPWRYSTERLRRHTCHLWRQNLLRGHESNVGLKVMSLARYLFSTPL